MISGVSAYSNAYSSYATSSAQRSKEAEEAFSVPESALRAEEAAKTAEAQQTQAVGATRDPAADSVELSRNYPQLVVNQTYAPPPTQQVQQVAGLDDEAAAKTNLDQRGDEAVGAETLAAVEEDHAIPGQSEEEDGETETAGMGGTASGGTGAATSEEDAEKSGEAGEADKANGENLSEEEQAQVKELANRDREVRAHEQAHQAVGGRYSGGASYEYQQGPDGQRYAVGGEVSIDISAERDPQATIAKMQQVKAAAMAPAEPSGQDRSVAAAATATEAQARAELAEESSAAGAAGSRQGGEGGEGDSEAVSANGVGGVGAASLESNANPYVERYQQQSRANPYQNVASTSGVLSLPNAYRAIDIVA